jgi:hypothetical protein
MTFSLAGSVITQSNEAGIAISGGGFSVASYSGSV